MAEEDFCNLQQVKRPEGKSKAKAKAKSGTKGGTSRPAKQPCLCCEEMRHANSRFCKDHKRSYDSMAYQAKKSATPGAEEAFKSAMEDDITAKNEVLKFAELNPPDQRYARKQFIDWAAFKQLHGQKTEFINRSKCTPMWEGEFLYWAQTVKALPKADAEAWWHEHLNNPRIERDNDGYKGRLQLWIPKGLSRITDKSKFVEAVAEQGSKPLKDPNSEDIKMLKEHVLRQQQSLVDPFFMSKPQAAAGASSAAAPATAGSKSAAVAEGEGDQPPAKRARIDVDRQGPKLLKTMEKDLKAIQKSFRIAGEKHQAALTKLQEVPRHLLIDDLALLGLVRSLDLRVHFVKRWEQDSSPTDDQSSVVGVVDAVLKSTTTAAGEPREECKSKLSKSCKDALDSGLKDFEAMKALPAADLIKKYQARLPLKETDKFASEAKMRESMDKALQLARVEEYEELKASWQVLSAAANSIGTSIAKVAGDLAEHLETKVREEKRQVARDANAEKQKALKAIKDQAKKAAAEIKNKPKVSATSPVFDLHIDLVDKYMKKVPCLEATGQIQTWSTPWVVNDWQEGTACLTETSLKKSMDTFAAQYKKLGDSTGRHQYLLQAGAVKTTVDKMLKAAMPGASSMLDLEAEEVEGGAKFMASTWLYGFSPGMTFVGLLPNTAAQVRVHAKGEMKVLLFDWHSFSEKMGCAEEPFSKKLRKVEALQDDSLEGLQTKGVEMWYHRLSEKDLIYIPAGFVVVESCHAESAEVYGIRKSFFPLADAAVADRYRTVLNQISKESSSTGQMETVAASLDRALKKAAE